jgi:hypothetical protein
MHFIAAIVSALSQNRIICVIVLAKSVARNRQQKFTMLVIYKALTAPAYDQAESFSDRSGLSLELTRDEGINAQCVA